MSKRHHIFTAIALLLLITSGCERFREDIFIRNDGKIIVHRTISFRNSRFDQVNLIHGNSERISPDTLEVLRRVMQDSLVAKYGVSAASMSKIPGVSSFGNSGIRGDSFFEVFTEIQLLHLRLLPQIQDLLWKFKDQSIVSPVEKELDALKLSDSGVANLDMLEVESFGNQSMLRFNLPRLVRRPESKTTLDSSLMAAYDGNCDFQLNVYADSVQTTFDGRTSRFPGGISWQIPMNQFIQPRPRRGSDRVFVVGK